MRTLDKTFRPCTVKQGGRWASVYIRARFDGMRLSISGVVGPLPSGGALGSCGQIDETLRNWEHDSIRFCEDWSANSFLLLLDLWQVYHLNDMKAGCKHQRALGWRWITHPSTPCPVCGYKLGSAWLYEDVPSWALDLLEGMPESDKVPAWV